MTQHSTSGEEHGTGRLGFGIELVTRVKKNRHLTQPKNFESEENLYMSMLFFWRYSRSAEKF